MLIIKLLHDYTATFKYKVIKLLQNYKAKKLLHDYIPIIMPSPILSILILFFVIANIAERWFDINICFDNNFLDFINNNFLFITLVFIITMFFTFFDTENNIATTYSKSGYHRTDRNNSILSLFLLLINLYVLSELTLYQFAKDGELKRVKHQIEESYIFYDESDLYNRTPLHYSANSDKSLNVTIYLTDKGADIDIVDKYGNTPLHYAVKSKARKTVEYLLKIGASPIVKNGEGLTSEDISNEISDKRILKLIKESKGINTKSRKKIIVDLKQKVKSLTDENSLLKKENEVMKNEIGRLKVTPEELWKKGLDLFSNRKYSESKEHFEKAMIYYAKNESETEMLRVKLNECDTGLDKTEYKRIINSDDLLESITKIQFYVEKLKEIKSKKALPQNFANKIDRSVKILSEYESVLSIGVDIDINNIDSLTVFENRLNNFYRKKIPDYENIYNIAKIKLNQIKERIKYLQEKKDS